MGSKTLLTAVLLLLLVVAPVFHAVAEDESSGAAHPDTIDELIEDLGADEFPTRERASRRLIELGERARSALSDAMRNSDNLETRWRAEQILKRLDQQAARPLAPTPLPPSEVEEGELPQALPQGARSRLEALERHFEEMRRQLGLNDDRFGSGLAGPRLRRETLKAPGLALEIDTFGMFPNLTLRVTEEGQPPMTYRGRSLEAIVQRNPRLADHAGMKDLLGDWAAYKRRHPAVFAFDDLFGRGLGGGSGGRISVSGMGQGVSVRSDASGTTVEVTETDENGKQVTKTYTGKDLEAIKKEHPELAKKLGGFSLQFGPVQVFPGRQGRRPPAVAPEPRGEVFGVQVRRPDDVLASQLKLVRDEALLVARVLPGSQAESMGLHLYDIIVGIDDQTVPSVSVGMELLRRAAQTNAPLTLDVIRHGERMRLTR